MKFLKIRSRHLFRSGGTETPSVDWGAPVSNPSQLTGNEEILQQNPAGDTSVLAPEQRIKLSAITAYIAANLPNSNVTIVTGATPTPTGNTANLNTVLTDPNGVVWFIDSTGAAVALTERYWGAFDSHTHAGANGVPIGGKFEMSQTNTIGLPVGTVLYRRL